MISADVVAIAQVGTTISKAQKYQKDFKVSSILFYSTRMRIFSDFLSIFFSKSPVSRGPFGYLERPFCCKI